MYENSEPRNDVIHAAILEDVLERPGAGFHEFVLVVKVGFFSASALLMVEAQAYIQLKFLTLPYLCSSICLALLVI